jgi:two-component system sensor histidine kinase UhpB
MITLFFVVVNILVYIVVEQALKPITRITSALADVEAGNLTTRLPNFKLPELELIGHKFNLMASALEISTRDNHRLTQQIIRLQEVERKSLAQELHDEVGQHLTAIHVDACAIKRSDNLAATKKSADAIDEVVGQMVEILRSMLQRLRPGGLDNLSFIDALHQLLSNWQERHSFIELDYQIAGEFSQLDENVQLTLYRVIQECLTNISRHAQANQVNLSLVNANQQITLDVVDNGRGYNPSQPSPHFGIAGMKERIASVNGDIRIQTELKQGVALTVTIPNQRGTK